VTVKATIEQLAAHLRDVLGADAWARARATSLIEGKITA